MDPGFRLLPVLRYRVRREDACARAFAEAVRSVETALRHLAWLREQVTDAVTALEDTARTGAPAGVIHVLAEVPAALARAVGRAGSHLDAERRRAEHARRALVKASQDRQALERLQQIARDARLRRAAALVQREHDERATIAHRWRRTAPGSTERPR